MEFSRRHFLQMAGYGIGATALTSFVNRFALSTALAQGGGGYKALVGIFLGGGNDGNNTIVPIDTGGPTGGYDAYASIRGQIGGAAPGLGVPLNQLLPISTSIGNFGLHPDLGLADPAGNSLWDLWAMGKLAAVCNVGPLIQPMTQQQYRSGSVPKPLQLFSHSDQIREWQNSRADISAGTGWGGRIADLPGFMTGNFPMITSIAGTPIFTIGQTTRPLAIQPAPTPLRDALALTGFGTSPQEQAREAMFDYIRTLNRGETLVARAEDILQEALDTGALLAGVSPTLQTVFPTNNQLANQLKQVALMIKANQQVLNLNRQVFFCQLGGFDTHQNEVTRQATLLRNLGTAMRAFYEALVELGVSSNVVTFTFSDFNRTFQPAGTGGIVGTDHAWGNHHFVMGDAVMAADLFGLPSANGTVYPTLQLNGPDDTDNRGRWIPTASVEQYGATLASWYGVNDGADMAAVFPLLSNFNPNTAPYLGFLRAP